MSTGARTTRDRVRDALLDAPVALDAAGVADRVGVHITTARFHLDRLEEQGLVRRRTAASGERGRPRVLFSPAARSRADAAREQLVDVLAAALARDADATAASRLAGARWADALADTADPHDTAPGSAPEAALADRADDATRAVRVEATEESTSDDPVVTRLVRTLDVLGFAPERVTDVIRLPACPFRVAARAHPEVVCAVHRGLVEEIVAADAPGRRVRLLPFVEPGLCLVALDDAVPPSSARR